MRRRVSAAGLCALLALSSAPLSASAGPGGSCIPDQVRVWRIRRHGAAPRLFDAKIEWRSYNRRSTLGVFAAAPSRGKWGPLHAFGWGQPGSKDLYPYAYGGSAAPVTTPDRPSQVPPQACEVTNGSGEFPVPLISRRPMAVDWLVATINTDVTITLKSSGWTVTELPPASGGNLRIFRTYDGTGAGVETYHRTVEHFTGVAADGGRYGSVTLAWLPCDPDGVTGTQATGWGAAVLFGGDREFATQDRYLKCDGYDLTGMGQASGPTRWTLYGEAVGASVSLNRLTIFDFPKP